VPFQRFATTPPRSVHLKLCRGYSVSGLFLPVEFRRRFVGLVTSTVLWKNGWLDRDAVWDGEWGGPAGNRVL